MCLIASDPKSLPDLWHVVGWAMQSAKLNLVRVKVLLVAAFDISFANYRD